MEYIPLLATFFTAVLGLFGKNTWRPNQRGAKKLSLRGWALLSIATIALGTSYNQLIEKKAVETIESKISLQAYENIDSILSGMLVPCILLVSTMRDINGHADPRNTYYLLRRDNKLLVFMDEYLGSLNESQHIRLDKTPTRGVPDWNTAMPLWQFFFETFSESKEDLEKQLGLGTGYLHPQIVLEISALLQSEAMREATEGIPNAMKNKESPDEDKSSEFLVRSFYPENKPSFFDQVRSLKQQISDLTDDST